ncbi:MAG TPA: hypothetical protein DIU15_07500, partial [Deltaproteobacteria bacterium]|nr:hypothetical protein [Deltaproteobacteria bacterium]
MSTQHACPRRRLPFVLGVALLLLPGLSSAQDAPQNLKSVFMSQPAGLQGVAVSGDLDAVFGADTSQGLVYRWDGLLDVADQSVVGTADGQFSIAAGSKGIAAKDGRVFVVIGSDIEIYDDAGNFQDAFTPFSDATPADLCFVSDQLYVSEENGDRIKVFEQQLGAPSGISREKVVYASDSRHHHGIDYDIVTDTVWVTDDEHDKLRSYVGVLGAADLSTVPHSVNINFANGRNNPQGLAIDPIARL